MKPLLEKFYQQRRVSIIESLTEKQKSVRESKMIQQRSGRITNAAKKGECHISYLNDYEQQLLGRNIETLDLIFNARAKYFQNFGPFRNESTKLSVQICRSFTKSLLRFISTRSILSHYVIYNFGRSLSTNLCRPYISPYYNNRLRPPYAPPRSQGDTLDPLKMYANDRARISSSRENQRSRFIKK